MEGATTVFDLESGVEVWSPVDKRVDSGDGGGPNRITASAMALWNLRNIRGTKGETKRQ